MGTTHADHVYSCCMPHRFPSSCDNLSLSRSKLFPVLLPLAMLPPLLLSSLTPLLLSLLNALPPVVCPLGRRPRRDTLSHLNHNTHQTPPPPRCRGQPRITNPPSHPPSSPNLPFPPSLPFPPFLLSPAENGSTVAHPPHSVSKAELAYSNLDLLPAILSGTDDTSIAKRVFFLR